MSDKDKETYCWPIFFGDANGRKGTKGTPIQLLPGQLCVYKGTKVEHWREPFRGVHQAQVFLHWVEKKEENEADVLALFNNPMRLKGGEIWFVGGKYRHELIRSDSGWKSRKLVEETLWFDRSPFGDLAKDTPEEKE